MTRPPCIDHDPGDEDPSDEFERWAEADPTAALCHLIAKAGLTMTLYGVPVTEPELRAAALESAIERVEKMERSRGW